MYALHKSNNKESSRIQIDIEGVHNNVLILPKNKYRAIFKVSSINFELRSEDEQDAITDNYQNFLNSLPCSLQILFRVRSMDLDRYLESFNAKLKSEKHPVYRQEINNYSKFVSKLISENKILSRNFYVVIPFDNKESLSYELAGEQIKLYADIVSKGLARLGIHTTRLTSLEILDLFHSFYNADDSKAQNITEQTLRLIKRSYL